MRSLKETPLSCAVSLNISQVKIKATEGRVICVAKCIRYPYILSGKSYIFRRRTKQFIAPVAVYWRGLTPSRSLQVDLTCFPLPKRYGTVYTFTLPASWVAYCTTQGYVWQLQMHDGQMTMEEDPSAVDVLDASYANLHFCNEIGCCVQSHKAFS